jgi:hypothetical protein
LKWIPREVFSRPDVLEEASIEPHLLAQACNDVRKGGRDVPVMLTVGEMERYVGQGGLGTTSGFTNPDVATLCPEHLVDAQKINYLLIF